MDSKKEDKILEELLYEHSSKKMLKAYSKESSNSLSWLTKIAAIAGLVLFAYLGNYLLQDSSNNRIAKVEEVYEFPTFNKSRSSIINLIDPFITELNTGQYQKVLSKLYTEDLSETDLFAKVNIYFELDSLQQAKQLIDNTIWEDEYYSIETKWLRFLISYKHGEAKSSLATKISDLSPHHQSKARMLLASE